MDPDGGGRPAGLEEPRAIGVLQEVIKSVVIGDGGEGWDGDAGAGGGFAHGELVAEGTRGGLAEAGEAEVLAGQGGGFEVEFVEWDDACDGDVAHEVGDVRERLLGGEVFRHGVEAGEDVAGPIGVAEFVHGEEVDVAAERGNFAEEGLTFFVGADGEDGGARHVGRVHEAVRI